ncbi:uncharacterized protein A4U43_C07F22130 [Asparagus officinalis]|uniref:UDP-N-acetylmuramoyl-L-alanyl-D-glutamate--2,6-diaminopimelate ligase MurE homolog, chloroplastic n=1 Tax=Asparagus officinalis TaxID=4686 RepID=A0A5P1EDX8_ASPOF|nr:uncharacterized protein LOC109850429 [Asparagus officinalis]ONK64105.1 uncharacterized protein A4U43_C07F22130 [Asparagus officinalis]
MVLPTVCFSSSFSFPNYSTSPPLIFSAPLHSPPFPKPRQSISNLRHFSTARNIQKSFSLPHDDLGIACSCPSKPIMSSKSKLDAHEEESSRPNFKMTLSELLNKTRITPVSVSGNLDISITGIHHDSREVTYGDLYICCHGSKTDGHMYITEAIQRGASAILADKHLEFEQMSNCKAIVTVEDTNLILPLVAATFYRHPSKNLSVIGITGTNGKTTTTQLVKSIIEATGSRAGTLGTLGYSICGDNQIEEAPNTTPDAVSVQKLMAKMMHNSSNAVVMEVSSHGLALGRCNEIDFDIAVFTNLTRDHLDFHGTEEEYRNCKGKLFAKMVDPKKHRKVVNLDDPNADYFIEQGNANVPLVTFAMENKEADVKPLKCEFSLLKTKVLVDTPKGVIEISSKIIGRYNVYNMLASVAVGISLDVPLEAIVRGIEGVEGVSGRCELIDEGQAFAVIVDYAHTPDALSRLLDAARELNPRRIITVFGCGGERDKGKRPLMTKIAAEKSDIAILTSDNPRKEDPLDILDDMLAGIGRTMEDYLSRGENENNQPLQNGCRVLVHEIRRVALQAAISMGEEGDIVVVAGKGHETYQIEGDKKRHFDDREECRQAILYINELREAGIDTTGFPWQ